MKPIHIGLVLMAVICAVGVASAIEPTPTPTSATQTVSGDVPEYTITITAPGAVSGWNLERYSNNDKYIGTVSISSTAPDDWILVLDVTSDHESMYSPLLGVLLETQSMLTVDNGVTWEDLTTSTTGIHRGNPSSTTPYNFPIWIRQYVTGDDPSSTDYSITLTYTVSVTPGV